VHRRAILAAVPTPDELLASAPLEAAVAALAERNHHHLAQMSPAEREDAIAHWRQLAVAVLTAAAAALGDDGEEPGEGPGRAVIVLEDSGPEEIAIHATFFPQLEDLGGGEVGATPAQVAALELLEQISDEDDHHTG
jgi:hypothetical protein